MSKGPGGERTTENLGREKYIHEMNAPKPNSNDMRGQDGTRAVVGEIAAANTLIRNNYDPNNDPNRRNSLPHSSHLAGGGDTKPSTGFTMPSTMRADMFTQEAPDAAAGAAGNSKFASLNGLPGSSDYKPHYTPSSNLPNRQQLSPPGGFTGGSSPKPPAGYRQSIGDINNISGSSMRRQDTRAMIGDIINSAYGIKDATPDDYGSQPIQAPPPPREVTSSKN